MSMTFKRKLPIPALIKEEYPLTAEMTAKKEENDAAIRAILSGESARLLLIIGPCSADAKEPVLSYLEKLAVLRERVRDKIEIVPRIYTNKPRTNGDSYMGMLHQPDPDAGPDLLKGILAIRDIHMCALRDYGFSGADELLYPEDYRYLSDLLSYVAVGARSVENQFHRLTASGLSIPVGMKNPTGGDLSVMLNAVSTAQHRHLFLYRGWEVESDGNPFAHVILRGYTDRTGKSCPNYNKGDLQTLSRMYDAYQLKNPAVIVDTNHANSAKQYLAQLQIAKKIAELRRLDPALRTLVKGLMVESYLEDGAQVVGSHAFGKSITDPCLGWEKTERLVLELAENA